MSPYTSSEGSSFQASSSSAARLIFCASRACTAWALDWDAEMLELWPASVVFPLAVGPLVAGAPLSGSFSLVGVRLIAVSATGDCEPAIRFLRR